MSLFHELKRRNVIRVAAAYIFISWLLVQVIGLAASSFEAPLWVMKMIIALLLIGFIPTLMFSWAYELTPEGLKKDSEVDQSNSDTTHTAKKLDIITLMAIFGIAVLISSQQMNQSVPINTTKTQTDTKIQIGPSLHKNGIVVDIETRINPASIAVLPFVALSNDESDEYFGKGIAEELLNSLAQFPELKVAARTSAFSFEGKNVDLREVGKQLGVAHVLEGSVRRSGEKIRITAQLIRATDGFHLWSDTFERKLDDIFAIQDEIVRELSLILQLRLGVGLGQSVAKQTKVNPAAYDQYLRGLNFWAKRESRDNRQAGIRAFQRATELDSNFSDAWAALSISYVLTDPQLVPGESIESWSSTRIKAITNALELDPDNARAHAAFSFLHVSQEINIQKAQYHLDRTMELAPNAAYALYVKAQVQGTLGDYQTALKAYQRAMDLDPFNETFFRVHKQQLAALGRIDEALRLFDECSFCSEGNKYFWTFELAFLANDDELRNRRDDLLAFVENDIDSSSFAGRNFITSQVLLGEISFEQAFEEIPKEYERAYRLLYIANQADVDAGIDSLIKRYNNNNIFDDRGELFIMPNRFEASDAMRHHTRYHEFWSLPGMPELAEIRLKNGAPWGLPLPINENNSQ